MALWSAVPGVILGWGSTIWGGVSRVGGGNPSAPLLPLRTPGSPGSPPARWMWVRPMGASPPLRMLSQQRRRVPCARVGGSASAVSSGVSSSAGTCGGGGAAERPHRFPQDPPDPPVDPPPPFGTPNSPAPRNTTTPQRPPYPEMLNPSLGPHKFPPRDPPPPQEPQIPHMDTQNCPQGSQNPFQTSPLPTQTPTILPVSPKSPPANSDPL